MDRGLFVTALDAWLKDFRQAALDHIDNGGNPPDMLRVAQLVADSKANRRASEDAGRRQLVEPARPLFSRN